MVSEVSVGAPGASTKTDAVSALPQLQLAMTRKDPTSCPAVYKPPIEIVPPVALYVTVTERVCPSDQLVVVWNC
jgi:hypothetical protein